MRTLFVLTALLCGLYTNVAQAGNPAHVKLAPTTIGLEAHNRLGAALSSPDSVIQIVWDQFGKRVWPKNYWVKIYLDARRGEIIAPAVFPINPDDMWGLWFVSKFTHHPKIIIGLYVLDGQSRPIHSDDGVHILLKQLGAEEWPKDMAVSIDGDLDSRGHILVTVEFPLNSIVVKNLTTMAKAADQ